MKWVIAVVVWVATTVASATTAGYTLRERVLSTAAGEVDRKLEHFLSLEEFLKWKVDDRIRQDAFKTEILVRLEQISASLQKR
jgi:hypothetical protein